ncbi:MAG TPA: RNA polymerase sigma factor [Chitinophagaceae bacterium]|nr:RNA polymerase sigma factor [Chitinophagaceae bacterium]
MPERRDLLPESEQQLIKGCLAGERMAQSGLYARFAPKMFGVCMRYAKNREEAEEIMHEGFLRAFTYLHQFRGSGSLEGWIRRIMVNCALLRYRSKSALAPVIHLDEAPELPSQGEDSYAVLEAKELLQLIQELPAGYRMVFNLYVFEGMKHREIAEALGISEGTSKSNLFDARALLQKALRARNKIIRYK